jgi:SET domain-containing protein
MKRVPARRVQPIVNQLPRIVRRRSPISGWGVYAAQPIDEDARIVEYKGALISQPEAWRREQRYLPRQRIWIFELDDRWARDAAYGGNIARYVNHSCRPNCYIDIEGRHIWIKASRPIRAGEELVYDYNTDGVAGIPCRCRPGCRRII